MIRHIVLFKIESTFTDTEKTNIKTRLKDMLLDLEHKIKEIRSISVWLNAREAKATNYDIMLDTTFDSLDALERYRVHPDHVNVLEYVNSIKLQRVAIDSDF